MTLTPLASN